MWSMLGPRGLEKLFEDIIKCGCFSHPEAKKTEEQHHDTQCAYTQLLLALRWLLFES
jgi:hypothetical protein